MNELSGHSGFVYHPREDIRQSGITNGYQPSASNWGQIINPSNPYGAPLLQQTDWPSSGRGQKYVRTSDLQKMQSGQYTAEQQNAAIQAQIDAANAQAALAREQLNTLRRNAGATQPASKPYTLPKAEFNSRYDGKVDLWAKVQGGEVLSDPEMAQLFHSIDLAYYSANTTYGKQQAEKAATYAEEVLAKNIVANAESDGQGNMVINGVKVPRESALQVAKLDIQHFREKGEHLPANKLKALGQKILQLGIDLGSATILMSTGALKGATLGYLDLAGDAKQASRIIGANPAIAENPYFNPQTVGDFLGMGIPVASISKAVAGTGIIAQGAITGSTLGGLHRREGELSLDNQLQPYERVIDAMIGAGFGIVIAKLATMPTFRKLLEKRLKQNVGTEFTLDDLIERAHKGTGWSQGELDFYLGRTSEIPRGSRYDRRFWSTGYDKKAEETIHPINNAFDHASRHAPEFGLEEGTPYYLELADDTIPRGSHIKVTADGKQYFYDATTDTLFIREAGGTPKSMFQPGRGKPEKGWQYFERQEGKYKGTVQ